LPIIDFEIERVSNISLAIETEKLSVSQALEKLNCRKDVAEDSASGATM
jgi:hypothetical protein